VDDADRRFDQLIGELDYPMYIATTSAGGVNSGCLVGFGGQASINPRRFLVCLSVKNHTTAVAAAATHLAVHLVGKDELGLAHLFGEQTGDQIDKFARCRWSRGPADMPVLEDAAAWFVGRIEARFDFGDHLGHLLAPLQVGFRPPIPTIVGSADVRGFHPGHDA
jgi:flavin reductase (DIM6/NTAB) family NADH-FMN oxidoreductase RutF